MMVTMDEFESTVNELKTEIEKTEKRIGMIGLEIFALEKEKEDLEEALRDLRVELTFYLQHLWR